MWKNKLKTMVLLATLSGLFLFVGNVFGGNNGMLIALSFSLIMNGIAYFFSDRIVLALYGAKPLDHQQYPHVVGVVRELSETMHLPMPRLWIVETPAANAFATGRNPAHSSIALTTGILEILEPHELRGVLAHEMSHIYNRDILVTTLATIIATAIGYIADMAQRALFWGTYRESNRKNSGGILGIIGIILGSILIPLAATILQLSISRSREYLADETGAHACQDPLALASALQKLHRSVQDTHFEQADSHARTASLFIVHPFVSKGLMELFSTHPPLKKRVERLQKLYENGLNK